MREIVFDTETTGLDPEKGHKLVEMGCIELIDRVPTGNHFHAYYNPERDMPAEAEAVHGLSAQFLNSKPVFQEEAAKFLDFIGDAPLVAHNAGFDFKFMNYELKAIGLEPICTSRMIDTLAMARTKHPGSKHTLDALCVRYGIDRSHRVKHGALLDAELLAQLYIELTGGRQIGLGLAGDADIDDESTAANQALFLKAKGLPIRQPRPHAPSQEELAAHQDFIKKLKSPLWDEGPSRALP